MRKGIFLRIIYHHLRRLDTGKAVDTGENTSYKVYFYGRLAERVQASFQPGNRVLVYATHADTVIEIGDDGRGRAVITAYGRDIGLSCMVSAFTALPVTAENSATARPELP